MTTLHALLSLAFLAQVMRMAVPYALAAVGGSLSERSGIIDIALEGKLLFGAFGATIGAYYSGSVAVGVLAGVAAGAAVAALYATVVIRFRADQIVAGVAINMLAYGATRYLLEIPFHSTASSPRHAGFGPSLAANPVLWFALVLIAAAGYVMYRTPPGLRLRASGEHPGAVASLGISVARVRWVSVLSAGAYAGLGGAWLSLSQHSFVAEMSRGRGYIALAAVIMGRWNPLLAALACLLFATADAFQVQFATTGSAIPSELLSTLPYALTILVLAGFMWRSRPPAALGKSDDA